MSLSQPVSRRPSVANIHFGGHSYQQQHTIDDLLYMNGLSTLSHVSQIDLVTTIDSMSPAPPDLYSDFSFLLDRLEVPSTAGSGSNGTVPTTASPAASNRKLSLSPLCFRHHSRSRSRSNSPSPDTAAASEVASAKCDSQNGTRTTARGKVQKMKIPRHKRPSHQRAEAKRRTRIQVSILFTEFKLRLFVLSCGNTVVIICF